MIDKIRNECDKEQVMQRLRAIKEQIENLNAERFQLTELVLKYNSQGVENEKDESDFSNSDPADLYN